MRMRAVRTVMFEFLLSVKDKALVEEDYALRG